MAPHQPSPDLRDVRRWSIRLARPTITLDVAASPDLVLTQLGEALRKAHFRVRPAAGTAGLHATRVNWWWILAVEVPERWTVDVTASAGGSGTLLQCTFVRGTADLAMSRFAARLMNDAIARFRTQGITVAVGAWSSALPARRSPAR